MTAPLYTHSHNTSAFPFLIRSGTRGSRAAPSEPLLCSYWSRSHGIPDISGICQSWESRGISSVPHTLALTATSSKTTATCFLAGLIRAEGSCLDFYLPVWVPHKFDAKSCFFFVIISFTLNMKLEPGCINKSTPDERLRIESLLNCVIVAALLSVK